MRSRNIKPGFFQNEQLGECTIQARLLFIGLWCMAAADGILEDRPKRIKAAVFPFDSVDVEPLLQELAKMELIARYISGSHNLIYIHKFCRHQRPHKRESVSGFQPPAGNISGAPEKGAHEPALNEECGMRNEECGSAADKAAASEIQTEQPAEFCIPPAGSFAAFADSYPIKTDRHLAEQWWNNTGPNAALVAEIMKSLELQKRSKRWTDDNGKYITSPVRWLREKKWRDVLEPAQERAPPEDDRAARYAEILADRKAYEERMARVMANPVRLVPDKKEGPP